MINYRRQKTEDRRQKGRFAGICLSLALVVPCVSMPSIEVLANTKTVEAF